MSMLILEARDWKRLGKHMRAKRLERGLTINELADKAKVFRRTIQRVEHAKHVPRVKTLDSIAKALGYKNGAVMVQEMLA